MKVESSSYEAYLEALEEWKQKMQESQATQQKEENSATDSYVPGISQMDMDIPMPSSTYNAQGMMSGERPPMPPMPPQETDETTESTQVTGTTPAQGTAATGTETLLAELSETFRANPDSILMKLDELGLSLEDLSDEDNIASLATAMNEGAANMGLPTIEDLDSAVSTLHEKLSAKMCIRDRSKFSQISSVTFAPFEKATVITTELKQEIYKDCSNIINIE